MLRLTRKQLSAYTGRTGERILIGYKGDIYDVSQSDLFQFGLHFEHEAGEDLTEYFELAPHGEDVFNKFTKVGIIIESTE